MRTTLRFAACLLFVLGTLPVLAQEARKTAEPPALTIYNGGFAIVRQAVPLRLEAGVTHVTFADVTAQLEPESVILRDLTGKRIQVLEQNYRNDPVTQELLLSLFEGQELEFLEKAPDGTEKVVRGKVVRSGYVPGGNAQSPIIESDGNLRFSLPGEPLFPALGKDTVLKPTLNWLLRSEEAGDTKAELSYLTNGMGWHADYNIVAPEKPGLTGDTVDMIGWVTIDNNTGKTFEAARIKLMAGDVHRVQPPNPQPEEPCITCDVVAVSAPAPPVSEKSFDEFHLYTLANPSTLHDQETKQVEFVRAEGVKSTRFYVYDGTLEQPCIESCPLESMGSDPEESANYGMDRINKKVGVFQEFRNSKENHLGIALPEGRVRFYRRDEEGALQFTGENTIEHTPKDETVRFYTGNAFDLVGERRQTKFQENEDAHWMNESFEIKLRNHKKTPVTVRVVEHLYRWSTWEIRANSAPFKKRDSQTIEFAVAVPPDGERVVTYTAHYTW